MALKQEKFLNVFQLTPLKPAKVSEISEATASSPIPPDERVNFHIGNPVQDDRLIAFYQNLVLGSRKPIGRLLQFDGRDLLEEGLWEKTQEDKIDLICRAVRKSVPYMPRGGFNRKNPGKLAELFVEWLADHQEEPLRYDLGKESGEKEVIFASGGLYEVMRVILFTLSEYLQNKPARILFWQVNLPAHLNQFEGLEIVHLPEKQEEASQAIERVLKESRNTPVFLVMGAVPTEHFRRQLRQLIQRFPLFFIEANDAPNHLSLAREAGLLRSVLRILSPAAIDPYFSGVSVVFVIGNSEFLKAIETVHFELKGTPPAADVELMAYLLHEKLLGDFALDQKAANPVPMSEVSNPDSVPGRFFARFPAHSRVPSRVEQILESRVSVNARLIAPLETQTEKISQKLQRLPGIPAVCSDPFVGKSPSEITEALFKGLRDPGWRSELDQAFLSSFLGHHPEYRPECSMTVSGSSRTALSLLGFHCGITDVIVPDLSWTYEHCFPDVETVPLTENFSLDCEAIIQAVERKLNQDSSWSKSGAVVLNNPHNASGQTFDDDDVAGLLEWLMERRIHVIDDLAYENISPSNVLNGPSTLRQLANQLVKTGRLRRDQTRTLITVHSLSKTDCFAGGRLSVVEIRDPEIRARFKAVVSYVQPNIMALLLAYLFYRHDAGIIRSYWTLRNRIFGERMQALETAQKELPAERNPYGIAIRRPRGCMYPQLVIQDLPAGISLDWLSSGLAKRGIGLVPLTTFARLERGYDLGRKTFRLTLGGTDGADALSRKMRRVLIDLNRIIADESTSYVRKSMAVQALARQKTSHFQEADRQWSRFSEQLIRSFPVTKLQKRLQQIGWDQDTEKIKRRFLSQFLPERLRDFTQRFKDNCDMSEMIVSEAQRAMKPRILHTLEKELYKESLEERSEKFRHRLSDRTVHPTQMFALKVDTLVDRMIETLLRDGDMPSSLCQQLSDELVAEFLGTSIPIRSHEEGDELLADLRAMSNSEEWAFWNCQTTLPTVLSFWGDWDGSSRPSGQGHRLVAAALLENVTRLSKFLEILMTVARPDDVDASLVQDMRQLSKKRQAFWNLLHQITSLTNQLEKRYLNVLPFAMKPGKWRRLGMRLHMARDPVDVLWLHNDRLEAKMLKLRWQRRKNLEYYFSLNKRLRKALFSHLDLIGKNLNNPDLALAAGRYRSLLRRFVLTPRIHQKMVLSLDQFAIDTTVHNMTEINEISGKYGNPGMVMALQVSFSTDPDAFITLERKLRSCREEILRASPDANLPAVWVVPLFEDLDTVNNLDGYLDRLWEYAVQSRRLDQAPSERFAEMVCELFVAGSDLSQQVGQQAATVLYKQAKQAAIRWFAAKSLVGKIRIKLGSGEPMQRQGGYYDPKSGCAAVVSSKESEKRLADNLKASTMRSTAFAVSPLRGIFSGGEFRTFQSNLSEKLRVLSFQERAQIMYHILESQKHYEGELVRAAEPLEETRLSFEAKGLQELEMLTRGVKDDIYDEFVPLVTRYFRQILYGREEDVVGIHVISYFVSRSMPILRDRPVVRPSRATAGRNEQQVIERLAHTLPLANYGSLLRAIGHNRAQTMILGVNQLSTGLFRALSEFADTLSGRGEEIHVLSNRILPHLPVQDILHTLRIYHEPELRYVRKLEAVFPAGNSAFLTLREDIDSLFNFIGFLQKEFLRRQGLSVSEFFAGDQIRGQLLPALRPDIAVLLQPDLFNTHIEEVLSHIGSKVDDEWSQSVQKLLEMPLEVRLQRKEIWNLISLPIEQQVESFVGLALAIDKLSTGKRRKESLLVGERAEIERLGVRIADLLRGAVDDPMRQFLTSAVQYLVQVPQQMDQVPIEILRALRDVEQIVRIEKQALGQREQDLLRFLILQIARLCGENG